MKLIDLSVDLNEKTPIYPGDPVTKIAPSAVMETDGYEDHYVSVGTHVGTHVDAPRHMLAGGKSLDKYPIEKFIGRGVVISCGKEITLEKVKEEDILEGDIVLFNTGMSKEYFQSSYYDNYPAIGTEIADYLVNKKIKMVGVDMCSVDHEPFDIHRLLLKNDILIIENLTNLDVLVGKNFTVYALPLKLQIDGSPARVFAQINQ
ncbi:MAG TPA: cyclase family protein [Candidatus Nanoarchaeia archaeon]|nr:kynurenine formamidase [uncultured archaeon]